MKRSLEALRFCIFGYTPSSCYGIESKWCFLCIQIKALVTEMENETIASRPNLVGLLGGGDVVSLAPALFLLNQRDAQAALQPGCHGNAASRDLQ